ncbi:MAG: tyrosine-type recombinase/integrase, partial [Acidimicrobiales bacterium]
SNAGTLSVSGSIKRETGSDGQGQVLRRGDVKRSRAGLRTIVLSNSLVTTLLTHRAHQEGEQQTAGEVWTENGLIFSTEVGTYLDPSNVRRTFARIAGRAGLDVDFPYALRHTAASLLLDAGKSVEEVADLLGDDPRTIYHHYRHRVRAHADAAAGPMDALFGSAVGPRS